MAFGIPQFRYRTIGDATLLEIADLLERGQSTVILGPRGTGKRYLFALLEARWNNQKRPFGTVPFGNRDPIAQEAEVVQLLLRACCIDDAAITSLREWEKQLRIRQTPNLLLMVSNVEGLSKDLARRFLATLRGLVQDRVLTAIITGESNLVDLVHGPTSEFNCSEQFVVHAHDRPHFDIFVSKRMRMLGLFLPTEPEAARQFMDKAYQMTGGDVSLARSLLWCLNDLRGKYLKDPTEASWTVTADDIFGDLMAGHLIPTAGLVPFRYATRCVECDRESWQTLQQLLINVPRFAPDNAPTTLELAGLVKRDEGNDDQLLWASAYAEAFVRGFFTNRRMGDLFASVGDWVSAFACFEKMVEPEKKRPLNDEDYLALNRVLDALTLQFTKLASGPPGTDRASELKNLLRRSCREILGFMDVSYWRFIGDNWHCHDGVTVTGMARQLALAARNPMQTAEDWSDHGWCWTICSQHREQERMSEEAVIVSGDGASIFPSRRTAILRLLAAYRHAWEHASLVTALHTRVTRRRAVLKITEEILHRLGNSDLSVPRVVGYAADQLVAAGVGVTRVAVLLAWHGDTPEKLQLAYDTAIGQSSQSVPEPISADFSSEALRRGRLTVFTLQQVAVWKRFLSDPIEGGIVAIPLGEGTGLSGKQGLLLCVFPNERDLAREILEGLEIFGVRLGPTLELARKFALLQNSLDSMHNPTLILDARKRALFLNLAVEDDLGLKIPTIGWQDNLQSLLDLGAPPEVNERICDMLANERTVSHVEDLTKRMAGVWLASVQPLWEWNGQPAGWFIYLRNRALLFQSFELMRAIERAQTVNAALQILADQLRKYHLGDTIQFRVYLIDPENPDILKSYYSAGLDPLLATAFAQGQIVMPRDTHRQGWKALEEESRPVVFRWQPNTPDGIQQTRVGLRYLSVRETFYVQELQKKPGDFWIDVPLYIAAVKFGKLTIALSSDDGEQLTPEIGEWLHALSFVVGDLIERLRRDISFRAQLQASAEEALAQTAHNLVSKMAGMPHLLARYRLHQEGCPSLKPVKGCPSLKQVNDDLAHYYDHAVKTLRRIKDRVGAIKLGPKHCDLAEITEQALKMVLGDKGFTWDWEVTKPELWGDWDPVHAENVFTELAYDSKVFAHPDRPLRITISAAVEDAGSPKEKLRLIYKDNGRGVRPEHKKEIFGLGASFREDVGLSGTGVGLHYVMRVVMARNGTVEENGKYGSGACFEFVLPTHITKSESPQENDNYEV